MCGMTKGWEEGRQKVQMMIMNNNGDADDNYNYVYYVCNVMMLVAM